MADKPYRDGPHVEDTKSGLSKKMRMNNCACRLCYLALNPPKTWALYESFGLDKILKEQSSKIFNDKHWTTGKWYMSDSQAPS